MQTKKTYNPQSIEIFNKLKEMSNLPANRISKKHNLAPLYYGSGDELVQKLFGLMASHKAGNTGVGNQINAILDQLLKINHITKADYQSIYKEIFSN